MDNTKNRATMLLASIWTFLAVYLVLIAGPDYLPRIFVHHDIEPLEWSAVLSALAGYFFLAAPLFLLRGRWFRGYAFALMFFAALGFFVSGYVLMRFRMPVHTGTLDLLATTSLRESREFMLRELASLSVVYYVTATVIGLLIVWYTGRAVKPIPNRKQSAVAAGLCVLPMA